MRTSFLQNVRIAAALLAIPLAGSAADPVDPATPIYPTDRAGLQITLKTGGYKFNVSAAPVAAQAIQAVAPSASRPLCGRGIRSRHL